MGTLKNDTSGSHFSIGQTHIGYILAILGNILISISLNMQKHVHVILAQRKKKVHHLKVPFWWVAILIMVLGEIGNFAAYGFAPASAVAPLGVVCILFNMIIAYSILSEQLRPEDIYGSSLAVIGAIIIISFSRTHEQILNGDELWKHCISIPFIIYSVLCLILLIAIGVLILRFKIRHFILFLMLASISSSFTVVSAKAVSGMLELMFQGMPQWQYPLLYVFTILLFATAIFQVLMINKALNIAPASVVVPSNFVFFTTAAVISGIIFYEEFEGYHFYHIILFIFGCLWSFLGVFFFQINRGLCDVNNKEIKENIELTAKTDNEDIDNDEYEDDDEEEEPVWSLGFVSRSYPQPLESELDDPDRFSHVSSDTLISHLERKKYGAIRD